MGPEPLILNGYDRRDEVFGDLVIVHQHPVLLSVEGPQFFLLAGIRIGIVNGGGQVHSERPGVHIGLG